MEIKIKKIKPLEGYRLYAEFEDGEAVIYQLTDDLLSWPGFSDLKNIPGLFESVQLDKSRTIVFWNDEGSFLPWELLYYGGKCEKM
ncbi:MAG: hypothetical protein ACI4EA_08220 [Candidatus Ornithomonoglobus sp.]